MENFLSPPKINYLAVLVSALAIWALGALWYSKLLFGEAWMKATGITEEKAKEDFSPMNYVWALAFSFIASYGVARIMLWSNMSGWVSGLKVGILVGICFSFSSFWINDTFENRPCALRIINGLYYTVGLIIAGVIIGVW